MKCSTFSRWQRMKNLCIGMSHRRLATISAIILFQEVQALQAEQASDPAVIGAEPEGDEEANAWCSSARLWGAAVRAYKKMFSNFLFIATVGPVRLHVALCVPYA